MGFLYGTVFAVFYAVFGIPLARFADVYVRKNLISVGLMFWSAMTALSGFAKSFPQLANCGNDLANPDNAVIALQNISPTLMRFLRT